MRRDSGEPVGAEAGAGPAGAAPETAAAFDALSEDHAAAALSACCSSPEWVRGVLAGRPYVTAERLFAAADAVLAGLDDRRIDAALAGHPRIGDRPVDAESARDQAGIGGADRAVLDALAEGNRAYEQRFGHIYLVCAAGRTGGELLEVLRSRLDNDPATEREVMRAELAKINRVRLGRLLDELDEAGGSEGTVSTHVLDAVRGMPAVGVAVALYGDGDRIAVGTTNDDGRVPRLAAGLRPGTYRLVFDTGDYFAARGEATFYPEVTVTFAVTGPGHHHVPLLLSPFAYSTYRGS